VDIIRQPICFESVYYVESSNDLSLDGMAIRPTIKQDRISWEDTGRGRSFQFNQINLIPEDINYLDMDKKIIPGRINFTTVRGKKIQLAVLTLAIFNNKIKDSVAGPLNFQSDEELINYYLNTNFFTY
jgi:hypothetical protein